MMYSIENLPDDYISLNRLNLCSNKLIGGGFPFSLHAELPLIVGKGATPMIWLQGGEVNKKNLTILIDGNISKHPDFLVTKPESGVVEIFFKKSIKILRVKSTSDDSAIVSSIDFRPIGLNIIGNQDELKVGSSSFSRNTIEGASVFLGLG